MFNMRNVAIDGPSGAGKSTISKKVAAELSFIYVDTGALYRAVGLYMLRAGIDTRNENAVVGRLCELSVNFKYVDGLQHVFLNGEDVTEAIRQNECSMAASDVSAFAEVRSFLMDLQRNIAKTNDVIMDGRDIGTVVLPDAQLKIFLTATAEDRANRRFLELSAKGQEIKFETLLTEIIERDHNDSTREVAPLKQADDAILIDTTGNEFSQSVLIIKTLIKEKFNV